MTFTEFEELWPKLLIPAEYDSMDAIDQQCWRIVLRQAFEAGQLTHIALLRDWQEFVSTVKISYDAQVGYEAGSIRLDSLKARTQEVLKP